MIRKQRSILFLLLGIGIWACQSEAPQGGSTLFKSLPAKKTGIDFVNQLSYNRDFNIYTYRNFYNGGGVAIGDINNDSLPDLYFTGNMVPNQLYLNKGDFQFENITEKAGVAGQRAWSTGVSMADVNADGWLDIYVCNSGDIQGDNKQNELFINQQDGTFKEMAATYGLADPGYSTHAAFFDYDRDGDLDLYLLNNSYQAIGSFNLDKTNQRPIRDSVGGDKLLKNVGNSFVDVSEEAGIYGSIIGFGLGVTVGDVNRDGWQDIYVSNDFFERDYLYLNQQNGTFKEVLAERFRSISAASMGADMADINNDGYPDIFVTDMLPETDFRLKTATTFDSWDRYQLAVNNDYHHQFTRNMLHLNNQDGSFSEIGRLAGVEASDWSWGALMADFDNDGWRDLFIANGIYQDLTDQDFIQFISNEETIKMIVSEDKVDYQKLIDAIPSVKIPNCAFKNQGGITFENKAEAWGLAEPSHSNGSAYGDLDNDGDLDLVVSNVNMPPFIYRNQQSQQSPDLHWLQLHFRGRGQNTAAIGAKVVATIGGTKLYQEHMPMRGFQSSMDYVMHLGLGKEKQIDSLEIFWPNGQYQLLIQVEADQRLSLVEPTNSIKKEDHSPALQTSPVAFSLEELPGLAFLHQENNFIDFDRDHLLFQMLSTQGPRIAKGDVNGDGRTDLYVGGAKGQAGRIFLQGPNGQWSSLPESIFADDADSEDTDALFLDADNDGDLDLYVSSGGSEFGTTSSALRDRLYLNLGNNQWKRTSQILPAGKFESTSCVRAADYDQDGDQDLFVGIRQRPGIYGVPVNGYLLENDGTGSYTNVTDQIAPALLECGMVTDARWLDFDQDGDWDLVVGKEWSTISLWENQGGTFKQVQEAGDLSITSGWWNCLLPVDVDGDGDMDLIAGNHGLNSRFQAGTNEPIRLYVNDFDQNGTAEQILTRYYDGHALPFVLRHDLIKQLPHLKKKYLKYANYANQEIDQIFTSEELENTIEWSVNELASCLFINEGGGIFRKQALPLEAQFAPIYSILADDLNADGHVDIVVSGNLFDVKPEMGRYDADYGLVLLGNGDGTFLPLRSAQTGLRNAGAVRDLEMMTINGKKHLIMAHNHGPLQVFELKQ